MESHRRTVPHHPLDPVHEGRDGTPETQLLAVLVRPIGIVEGPSQSRQVLDSRVFDDDETVVVGEVVRETVRKYDRRNDGREDRRYAKVLCR